jgi:prophage tail gpP-like protein
MIKTCTCEHKAQDELHCKGRRVCNELKTTSKESTIKKYRCTVCLKEHN